MKNEHEQECDGAYNKKTKANRRVRRNNAPESKGEQELVEYTSAKSKVEQESAEKSKVEQERAQKPSTNSNLSFLKKVF